MNDHDARDREVRDYVRNRMAADVPPGFNRDVMNQVQRTDQRRRGFAWPIFTSIATVAAAVALVVIGLGLLNGSDDGVGAEPTSSASASPANSPSPSPSAEASAPEESASAEPTPSPTSSPIAEPTTGDGEFGPIHSMAPEEAFQNAQTCETQGVITTVGETTDIGWTISFPEGWFTNEETDSRSACTLFAPVEFELDADGIYPESVAIVGDVPPGGDFSTGGEITRTDEYTVDGVAAVRYEVAASDGGFSPDPMVMWAIAVAGGLPAEGNDRPYLILGAGSSDPDELAARVEVLDRMVATMDIHE